MQATSNTSYFAIQTDFVTLKYEAAGFDSGQRFSETAFFWNCLSIMRLLFLTFSFIVLLNKRHAGCFYFEAVLERNLIYVAAVLHLIEPTAVRICAS